MTQERLSYIFNQIANEGNFPPSYASPWVDGDLIYATNGHILLCLKNEHDRDKVFTDNGVKHPNARAIFSLKELNKGSDYYLPLTELDRIKVLGEMLGKKIHKNVATQLAHICRLFGMEAAIVHPIGSMFVVALHDDEGLMGAICAMSNASREDGCDLLYRDTESMTTLPDVWCDDDKGEAYYHKCLEDERKAEEEYNKENFDVFVVTLKKTMDVCVRARSETEAEEIAIANADDWDFDCVEVDGVEESCRYNECDNFYHYYDKDGEQDWEE